jgi:hypothetical protein
MISLDMTFMSDKILNCFTHNSRYNIYARTIFRKKLKSFNITQDITFILGKFSELKKKLDYISRYNVIAWKIHEFFGEKSDISRWYKLCFFMDMQIIISLHMMLLFGKNIFWAKCINVLSQFKGGRKWARHSKFQPQVHLETLNRNLLQLHNVITRDITVLHGTINI